MDCLPTEYAHASLHNTLKEKAGSKWCMAMTDAAENTVKPAVHIYAQFIQRY